MAELKIGDGQGWSFMHGNWTDGPDGELIPPDGNDVEYLAVRSDEAYGDFTTRFPHFAAHLSRDGGRTWDPPVIVDYSQWANQVAAEAEPDVVVVTYMGHCTDPGKADSRIARLRVTPEGLVLDH